MNNSKNDIEKPYYIVYPLPELVDIGDWYLNNLIGYSNSIGVAKLYYRQMIEQNEKYKNIVNIICIVGKNINEVADEMMEMTGVKINENSELRVYSIHDMSISEPDFHYVITDGFYSECMNSVVDEAFSQYGIHPVIVAVKRMIIICRFLTNNSPLKSLIYLLYKFYIVRMILCSNTSVSDLPESVQKLFQISEDYYYEAVYLNKLLYENCVHDMFKTIIAYDEELPFK